MHLNIFKNLNLLNLSIELNYQTGFLNLREKRCQSTTGRVRLQEFYLDVIHNLSYVGGVSVDST